MRCFLLFIVTFLPLSISAQTEEYLFQVRHITSRDGLPNEYIHRTLQASDKNVWISTNYGTVYYNGAQMYELPRPLDYVTIHFHEDVQDKIWLVQFAVVWDDASTQQVYIYNPETGLVVDFYEYFGSDIPVQLSEIVKITSDHMGNIWFYTMEDRLYCYDGTFKEIIQLPEEPAKEIRNVNFQIVPMEEQYLINREGWHYLWKIDASGKYEKITFPSAISYLQQDKNGTTWVITDKTSGIYKQTESGFELVQLESLPGEKIIEYQSIVSINSENQQIWYVDQERLSVYDYSGKLISSISLEDKEVTFKAIVDLYFDANGRAWLATDYGIYIINFCKNKFAKYIDDGVIKDTREILVDEEGEVFVALGSVYNLKEQKQVIPQHPIWFVSMAKKGDTFWGTTYQDMIIKVNAATLENLLIRGSLFSSGIRMPILHFSRKSGRLWIGGNKGLGIVDTTSLVYMPYQKLNDFASILDYDIKFFYETDEGIWLLTTNGLYLLDESRGIVAHYAEMFPERRVLHMHEDEEGIFWLATDRGGLLRWDRATNEVRQFTKRHGLSHNVIYAVYEDDFGYLWLPSQYGLMRFNKENYNVNIYLPEDGIIHPEFNRLSHAQAPDGRLYFGGLGGVVSFHPKDFIDEQPDRTPLRIVALEKLDGRNGKTYDFTQELISSHKIVLRPYEKSFRLDFVLLNFERPEENRYAYRIEEIDADWQYINENSLRITALPYGKYTLRIKGQSLDQEWSEEQLVIPVHVIRPFYLRWWFLLLSLIGLVSGVFAFIRRRTKNLQFEKKRLEAEVARRTATIQQQANELKRLDEQKSRFFLNVAHELRTPLTLIATPIGHHLKQSNVDEADAGFLRSIQKNVDHLLRLVESILDLSKLDEQQLQLQEEPTNLAGLIRRVFVMYESYAELHQLNYSLAYDASEGLEVLLDVPKLEKVLHNLLFNALKFTASGGSVKLQILELETQIQLQVIDTGKGIHSDELSRIFDRYYQGGQTGEALHGGSGIGLSIVREYAELMKGELWAESTPGKGSTFTLRIPKKMAAETAENDTLIEPNGTSSPTPIPVYNGKGKSQHRQRILLVEDNVEMQAMLRQIVTPHHDVLQAPNGAVALEILEKEQVDGIITDLMMPKMDGFEFVKRLKAHETWQHLPVIVLTARANDADKLTVLRIGVDDYLYKPFLAEELLVRIENLIAKRARKRQVVTVEEDEPNLSADQSWLQEVENCALSLLGRLPDFKINDLAECVHFSERHFRRKIQEVTGMTANEYLREIRLQRARRMLEQRSVKTVAEISNAVGFTSASYFSKLYNGRFGRKPSDYL